MTLQVIEHFYSSSPFLALIGPPRCVFTTAHTHYPLPAPLIGLIRLRRRRSVALLITGAACAGFAIRGEEKLIGAARKPLIEKAKADAPK